MILLVLLTLALPSVVLGAGAPNADTTRHASVLGAITVTNKGISLIPSFTLGKPATLIDLVTRKAELSFEPQFRVGLDGKPWSFVFWGRYRPSTGG